MNVILLFIAAHGASEYEKLVIEPHQCISSTQITQTDVISAVHRQKKVVNGGDGIAHPGSILMDPGDKQRSVLSVAQFLPGVEFDLHTGAVGVVLTLLGIELAITYFERVCQRVLVDGMLVGNGEPLSLVHAVARIELAGIFVPQRQIETGAGGQE